MHECLILFGSGCGDSKASHDVVGVDLVGFVAVGSAASRSPLLIATGSHLCILIRAAHRITKEYAYNEGLKEQ